MSNIVKFSSRGSRIVQDRKKWYPLSRNPKQIERDALVQKLDTEEFKSSIWDGMQHYWISIWRHRTLSWQTWNGKPWDITKCYSYSTEEMGYIKYHQKMMQAALDCKVAASSYKFKYNNFQIAYHRGILATALEYQWFSEPTHEYSIACSLLQDALYAICKSNGRNNKKARDIHLLLNKIYSLDFALQQDLIVLRSIRYTAHSRSLGDQYFNYTAKALREMSHITSHVIGEKIRVKAFRLDNKWNDVVNVDGFHNRTKKHDIDKRIYQIRYANLLKIIAGNQAWLSNSFCGDPRILTADTIKTALGWIVVRALNISRHLQLHMKARRIRLVRFNLMTHGEAQKVAALSKCALDTYLGFKEIQLMSKEYHAIALFRFIETSWQVTEFEISKNKEFQAVMKRKRLEHYERRIHALQHHRRSNFYWDRKLSSTSCRLASKPQLGNIKLDA